MRAFRTSLLSRNHGMIGARFFALNVKLPKVAVDALAKAGITELMPIQEATLQVLRSGVDTLARAKTGSGKTLAFLLPLMERLAQPGSRSAPRPVALIVEPVRELALQVERVIKSFEMNVGVACIYGGQSPVVQMEALRRRPQIIIGTPGRIKDFCSSNVLRLETVDYFVIDEADRLLDMGFSPDLEWIAERVSNPARQIVMFSATLPEWTRQVVKNWSPKFQTIDLVQNEKIKIPETIKHVSVFVQHGAQFDTVPHLLEKYEGKSLVFAGTRREAEILARVLPKSEALHGGVVQSKRERILQDFRDNVTNVLVCTDLVARGFDIPDVKNVLCLWSQKVPLSIEDYVHRSGRVGRCGQSGTSIIVHNSRRHDDVRLIQKAAGVEFEKINLNVEELGRAFVNEMLADQMARKSGVRRERDGGERRRRDFGERRERDFGERREREGGERRERDGERRDFGERRQKEFGERRERRERQGMDGARRRGNRDEDRRDRRERRPRDAEPASREEWVYQNRGRVIGVPGEGGEPSQATQRGGRLNRKYDDYFAKTESASDGNRQTRHRQ